MPEKYIIYGGSGGIGSDIARRLHARNCQLHLVGRDPAKLETLAAELAPKIRVNAIAPSLTRTPLSENLISNEQMATAIANMHAIPRLGEAEDVAALADILLSSKSSWITGQILGVDGGRSTLRIKS